MFVELVSTHINHNIVLLLWLNSEVWEEHLNI